MKVIVISPSKIIEEEIKNLTLIFEAGLESYHLRKPKFSTKQLQEYIEKIPKQFHNRIVIHSHHNLARKYDLQGVHYTKKHLEPNFRNWWREKAIAHIYQSILLKQHRMVSLLPYTIRRK